ncbi:MAG: hypothetical protein LBS35_10720, partial [Synergistaceae bacterium]|nr:hypothetical protein [Synergistaceae bacterium]
ENEVQKARDNDELSARLSEIVRETIPDVSADVSLAISHCMMKSFSAPHNDNCRENIYKAWTEKERGAEL